MPRELSSREAELQGCRQGLDSSRDTIKKSQAEINSLDIEIKTREEKIVKLEGEANRVRDNAQLLAIQHQIQTIRSEVGQFEDRALALFAKIETLEAEGKRFQSELAAAEEEFQRFHKHVQAEIVARQRDQMELEARRKSLVPSVREEVYSKYSRLLAARDGQAIAAVSGQICQGCFMEVVPNDFVKLLNGREIVQCRHCNRILYIPVEDKPS